ncbi:MAG: decaprenyl-phosphate phosphoribosyltransferase, partial [Myxococcota bacterium]
KQIAYLDVFCIATGFVLRVLAGGFAIRLHEAPGAGALPVSGYMLGCTAFLALFLGFGKRRHELASETATKQRKALKAYSARALWWALAFTGFGAVAVYFAYTFDPRTKALLGSDYLWVTTLHPLLGVLRFLQLVKGRPKAESPTEAMLRDVPFMANLLIWVVEVLYLFWPS